MVGALLLGLTGPLTITVKDHAVRARSVFLPARSTASVTASGPVAVCTFDPTATRVAQCSSGMELAFGGLHLRHRNETGLIRSCTAGIFRPHEVLRQLGVGATPSSTTQPADSRIADVGRRVRADPSVTVSAAESAAALGLSQAYFLTVFARETGTTFRRYRLWVRLIHAATSIADGKSLTHAAMDAGFSSPSHLSDTARALLGVSTSAALATGARLLVDHGALA
jgi:AraC-like DNA-binding protein